MPGAIEYAEDTLGVHSILAGVLKAREDLDKKLTELAEARDSKRFSEASLSDREMEIAVIEHGKHVDLSATAMKEHLKIQVFKDEACKTFRDEILGLTNEIEGMEYDRSILTQDIKIGCARMEELGGYLNYLAAIKNAASAARTTSSS